MKNTEDNKIKEADGILLNDKELDAVAGGMSVSGYRGVIMTKSQYNKSDKMRFCPECNGCLTDKRRHNYEFWGTCESCKIRYKYQSNGLC